MSADQRVYRAIFLESSPPPWQCCFCNEEVEESRLFIHHGDGDHFNHSPDNLLPCHGPCHTSHHHTGKTVSRWDNTSGTTGVHHRSGRGIWVARKTVNGRRQYVGSAKTAEAAARLLEAEDG